MKSPEFQPLNVTAQKWKHGWDLILDTEHATSVTNLCDAEHQVRDYLDTICPGLDHSEVDVRVNVLTDTKNSRKTLST